MFFVLPSNEYSKLTPLLGGLEHHMTVMSIVAGDTPGIVYVDEPIQPSAFLCCCRHRLYFGGSASLAAFNRALADLLEHEIYPQALAGGGLALVVYYDESADWQVAIEKIGGNRLSERYQRSYYRRTARIVASSPALPEAMTIQPIDDRLLEQTYLLGYADLVEELQSERLSAADFVERSFGFCALVENAIAGMCTSEYNSGARCEVGINTMEAFRRRGIAKALVAHFVDAASARGVNEIGWHCWKANLPSVATALASGFEHVRDYSAYVISLT